MDVADSISWFAFAGETYWCRMVTPGGGPYSALITMDISMDHTSNSYVGTECKAWSLWSWWTGFGGVLHPLPATGDPYWFLEIQMGATSGIVQVDFT